MSATPKAKALMRAAGMSHTKISYEAGNKYALFEAMILSAAGREPLPDWAREAFWKLQKGLARGEIGDLNEAFGWTKKGEFNKRSRVEAARKQAHNQSIFAALWEARRAGKGMTIDTFEEIATDIGVGRSMVENVWATRRESLLQVSAGDPPGNHVYAALSIWD